MLWVVKSSRYSCVFFLNKRQTGFGPMFITNLLQFDNRTITCLYGRLNHSRPWQSQTCISSQIWHFVDVFIASSVKICPIAFFWIGRLYFFCLDYSLTHDQCWKTTIFFIVWRKCLPASWICTALMENFCIKPFPPFFWFVYLLYFLFFL